MLCYAFAFHHSFLFELSSIAAYLLALLCAFFSSIFLMISSSSSAIFLSIFAPRLGSLPCMRAGAVGSLSPALVSADFTLPDVSVESPFASSAAARRFPMERSSSMPWLGWGQGSCWGGNTHWSRWLGGRFPFLLRTWAGALLSSLPRSCFSGHLRPRC
jgi:hypothetical protein